MIEWSFTMIGKMKHNWQDWRSQKSGRGLANRNRNSLPKTLLRHLLKQFWPNPIQLYKEMPKDLWRSGRLLRPGDSQEKLAGDVLFHENGLTLKWNG